MHASGDTTRRCLAGVFVGMGLWLALSGCTVGPDFVRPAPPKTDRYTVIETPGTIAPAAGGVVQHVAAGQSISGQWWELFRSAALNSVVLRSIRGNRSLKAARAALAAAQESVIAARGGLFPQVDVAANADRSKSPSRQTSNLPLAVQSAAPISNLYSVGTTVSYAADVFGGTRRAVEQQQAFADVQGYQLAAAYLSLTGNAVADAITIASLRAQIEATQEVIAGDQQNLSLVRQAFEAGKVARTDVLTAQTQLASDRTALPGLRQQLSTVRHALAILTGSAPSAWSAPEFDLEAFALPRTLPLSVPSKLVRQRPDILAAEARLHADSAAIGIATAQLYPSLTLSASLGQQSFQTGTLFEAANRFWSLSGGLLAPIFEGGTLSANRRAAVDTFRASLYTYEQTVLDGFQQVADVLKALAHDAQLVSAQRELLDYARQSLELQRISYGAGKTTILNLIDAERVYQQARTGLVRARAQRLLDSAQLFAALGGGWWRQQL